MHIINKLSSSVLKNKSPCEVLYNELTPYHELGAFRCLAFAANPVVSTDKFTPWGVPCVFLGYPPTQKGNRLLNIATKVMFVSRDVIFHESVFPFNITSNDTYLEPLSVQMPVTTNGTSLSFLDYEFEFASDVSTSQNTPI